MQFPRTLVQFQDRFPDESHCWAYLGRARWPRGFECPRCGGRGVSSLPVAALTSDEGADIRAR
jgi:hypothetical protein